MAVICLNCEGWGCEACKVDREAAKGGEQGPSPLDLQVEHLRAEVKRCRDGQARIIEQRDHSRDELEKTRRDLIQANKIADLLAAELLLLRAGGST